jgi:hypothetical protein
MTQRTFFLVTAIVFSLIAVGHALRLFYGWRVTIENLVVPIWISGIGLVIAAYLTYEGFRLARMQTKQQ